jgi:hypothetical protein
VISRILRTWTAKTTTMMTTTTTMTTPVRKSPMLAVTA